MLQDEGRTDGLTRKMVPRWGKKVMLVTGDYERVYLVPGEAKGGNGRRYWMMGD